MRVLTKGTRGRVDSFVPEPAGGLVRELLPDPISYYHAQGLILQGPRSALWRTAECRFHGGSDSMRISVATGGFRCMACGAKGGDVVAYEMAVHGIGFVEAAQRFAAWSGAAPQRHIRPTAMSYRDRLSVLADEANLIAIEGTRIGRGIVPSAADLERIRMAVARINHVRWMYP